MQSHRPPFTRCATNDGMGWLRCSCSYSPSAGGPVKGCAVTLDAFGGFKGPKIPLRFGRTGGSTAGTRRRVMALTGHGAAGIGICRLRPGCARRLAPIETGKNGMHYLM
ncbi:hypothetical protein KXV85_001221, partial [Aspergillus fumigatus]